MDTFSELYTLLGKVSDISRAHACTRLHIGCVATLRKAYYNAGSYGMCGYVKKALCHPPRIIMVYLVNYVSVYIWLQQSVNVLYITTYDKIVARRTYVLHFYWCGVYSVYAYNMERYLLRHVVFSMLLHTPFLYYGNIHIIIQHTKQIELPHTRNYVVTYLVYVFSVYHTLTRIHLYDTCLYKYPST